MCETEKTQPVLNTLFTTMPTVHSFLPNFGGKENKPTWIGSCDNYTEISDYFNTLLLQHHLVSYL